MAERRTVLYSGQVQGVGFRATTARLAQSIAVLGFVRNLPDGRVELVAEGEPSEIDRLLAAVEAHFATNIRDQSIRPGEATGEYARFQVRT